MPATTLALKPFLNRSFHWKKEYFCDGTTENIINDPANTNGLKVMLLSNLQAFE
ncbi:MAG: hypothetical protein NXI09_15310 [Bacteroidetes bacterium]|nr:hypothetical protein [Bacteroidota bacterium]